MKRKMNPKTVAWLSRVSGKEKWNILLLVLAQGFLGIASVIHAWFLRESVDSAVAGNQMLFMRYAAVLVVLEVAQILIRALKRFLDEYTKSGMENCFKQRLLRQLLVRDYASVTAVHSGEWMNRLTSDTVVVAEGMTTILPDMVGTGARLVGAVTALLLLIPELGYLIIPGGIVLMIFSASFRRVMKNLHKGIQTSDGNLRVLIAERLASMLIVRTYAREEQTMEDAAAQMRNHRNARMKRSHFGNFCNVGLSVVMNGVYLIGVLYCGYGILMGSVSYGSFTAVLHLITQVRSPFASLTGYLPKFYAMLASAERLMEVEDFAELDPQTVLQPEAVNAFYRETFRGMGLRNACFTYLPPTAEETQMPVVLENLDLEIRKGECVAFTGPSGSGKSTILKLLMSLYPLDSGERYLVAGEEEHLPLDGRYTRLFGYVPQGNQLMTGTIREIVAFSHGETMADEWKLRQALEIACALEFVDALPNGLDTMLGERGAGLSEGQMQRLAIARAVCAECPVLVLDEATSALDEATERKLVENLRQMTDRTVLLVTHRPEMLKLCNRQVNLGAEKIEVIDHGNG